MVFNERKRADARNGKGLRVAVAALTAVATLAGGGMVAATAMADGGGGWAPGSAGSVGGSVIGWAYEDNNNGGFGGELVNATSLKEICGHEIDENKLFERVAAELDRVYYRESRADVLSDYKAVCANLGKRVTVHYANGKGDIPGICTDILPDGSMNVDTENGTINVNSGEVSVKGIYEFERE